MKIVAGALAGTGPGAGWRLGADEAAANHCVAHTLRADGFDASEDGTGRGTPLAPVGVTIHGTDGTTSVASYADVASCLRARDPGRRDNSTSTVVQQPVAFGWQNAAAQGMPVDTIAPTLDKSKHPATLAFQERGRSGGRALEIGGDVAYAMTAPAGGGRGQERNVMQGAAVRRLMPVECERLQGFPDGWTQVPFRGKPAADGPRYKALGNSWAVNCARWVGMRIAMVDQIRQQQVERAA